MMPMTSLSTDRHQLRQAKIFVFIDSVQYVVPPVAEVAEIPGLKFVVDMLVERRKKMVDRFAEIVVSVAKKIVFDFNGNSPNSHGCM